MMRGNDKLSHFKSNINKWDQQGYQVDELKKMLPVSYKKPFTFRDVSPVALVFMLVFAGISSAGAVFLWESNYQADSSESIDVSNTDEVLKISGSSTVYPFNTHIENPSVNISVERGEDNVEPNLTIIDIGKASDNGVDVDIYQDD